jgi:hypothetical protein
MDQAPGDYFEIVESVQPTDGPNLSPIARQTDAILLRLNTTVRKPIDARPIDLVSPREARRWEDTEATILGWGLTEDWVNASQLQEAEIVTAPNEYCSNPLVWGQSFIPEIEICAGIPSSGPGMQDGVDSCNADSGGPLVVTGRRGVHQLFGLTSWGTFPCASDVLPGVYARVAPIYPWIIRTVFSANEVRADIQKAVTILGQFNSFLQGDEEESEIERRREAVDVVLDLLEDHAVVDKPQRGVLRAFSATRMRVVQRLMRQADRSIARDDNRRAQRMI